MAHHRCSGCKEESYPRHKYKGGVFCDRCIAAIRGTWYGRSSGKSRGIFGRLWDSLTRLLKHMVNTYSPKQASIAQERTMRARHKAMEAKALRMAPSTEGEVPQKR